MRWWWGKGITSAARAALRVVARSNALLAALESNSVEAFILPTCRIMTNRCRMKVRCFLKIAMVVGKDTQRRAVPRRCLR